MSIIGKYLLPSRKQTEQRPQIELPDSARTSLEESGISSDDLIFATDIDLSLARTYERGWICLTDSHIAIVVGDAPARTLALKKTEELKAENLVTSGLVSAKVQGSEEILCRFTSSRTRDVAAFVRIAEKLKKNEDLTTAELSGEREESTCPKCGRRYPDQNRKVCPKCLDKRSIFRRLLSYFSGDIAKVALIFSCMAAQAGLELVGPVLNGRVFFDEVLNSSGKYYGRIWSIFGLMLGIRVLAILVSIGYGRIVATLSARMV